MFKKKCLFILSTLLFLLLLGCYSTSYATSFTESELKNIIYNSLTNFGENLTTEVKNMCDSLDLSLVASKTQEYDYVYIICKINENGNAIINNYYMDIFFSNYIGTSKPTPTSCFGLERVIINFKDYNADFTWYSYQRETRITQNGWDVNSWRFNDQDLYQFGDGTGNMLLSSGWHPSNIDQGVFVDQYWSFTPSNSDVVYVPSFEPYKFEPMTLVNVNTTNLGTLIGGLHCDEIRVVRVYYSNNDWVMSKGVTYYKYPQNGSLLSFTGGTSDQDWTCPINMNLSNYANNILAIQFNSNDSNYPSIRHWFFIENNNTIVNNGNVDSNSTFSGDYYNSYNDQNNINNINDNNDLNTEEIVGAIGGLVSSDYSGDLTSGDIPSIDIEDPTEDFFTWFYRQFVNVLNNNNNVDLIIPIWKTDYRVPSDVFILDIEPLRSFISLGWWVIVGVPFLKFIRRSIEKLKGGNVPMSDEKSDLLGNVL